MPKYVIDYTVDPTNLVAMPKLELLRVATDIALRIFRASFAAIKPTHCTIRVVGHCTRSTSAP